MSSGTYGRIKNTVMTFIQLETHCRMLTVRRAVANMEKEKRKMSKKNNRINVPEARKAMDKFKMEAASDLAVAAPS